VPGRLVEEVERRLADAAGLLPDDPAQLRLSRRGEQHRHIDPAAGSRQLVGHVSRLVQRVRKPVEHSADAVGRQHSAEHDVGDDPVRDQLGTFNERFRQLD
jgi:hypothetical protein